MNTERRNNIVINNPSSIVEVRHDWQDQLEINSHDITELQDTLEADETLAKECRSKIAEYQKHRFKNWWNLKLRRKIKETINELAWYIDDARSAKNKINDLNYKNERIEAKINSEVKENEK